MMKYFYLLLFTSILSCSKTETKTTAKEELPQQNIAILIDNSITMWAKDFEPSRIDVVKTILKNIINHKKENQAFSIVVYSANSYILCPLTKDKNQLLSAIDKADKGIMVLKPGTNFSHGLLNGIASLGSELHNKSILLITDGNENIKSYPIDIPLNDAIRNNITINSVVMTAKDYALMPVMMDFNNKVTFDKVKIEPFDTVQISKITTKTGGKFQIFYTKKELEGFNFQKFFENTQKAKSENISSTINDAKLSKIYKEIQKTNDSLKLKFQ
ncbi:MULTISPECIES: VWA domain-containing protein [unclassified Chryseobacterium]|uniref:vWA domain-containing protein n=1 Tax=unclassified Chryseobacterium TaxID=2593645 RepID=UPI00226A3220|nr:MULTISPECIES: VWA domain-containing protein [unclassified Chryseobacterium]